MKQLKDKFLRGIVKFASSLYYKSVQGNKNKKSYIPASGKVIGSEELTNMVDASLDMWLTTGRFNEEFENKLGEFLGTKYVLTTNSGSSANLLALTALSSSKLGERKLQPKDEVITVAAGFPTTVNPIIQNGLIPVFVDIEKGTYNIDPDKIEEAISPKTKAIFIAHTLGNPFDIERVQEICKKHNLWLIEDSCDALGSEYKSQKVGSFADVSTFSFYPAHHITMGEGGAIATNNPLLKQIIMSFRDWGRDCWCPPGHDNSCNKRFSQQFGNLPFGYDHKYVYSHLGYNLKITDWQAAIALAQLKKLPRFIKKRQENFEFLTQGLKELDDYLILPTATKHSNPSWFGYMVSVRENSTTSKLELVKHLESNGIGTRQLFAGNLLRQPAFIDSNIPLRIGASSLINSQELNEEHYAMLPNTDFVMNNSFWVGLWHGLEEKDIKKTIQAFKALYLK